MPIDEVSEGLGLLRGLFRFIWQFFVEVIVEIVLNKTGWLFLKLVTLGSYPPPHPKDYNEGFVTAVGIVVAVCLGSLVLMIIE